MIHDSIRLMNMIWPRTGKIPGYVSHSMNSEKKQLERDGIQNVVLTPQITNNLISLKADFPSQFTHLLNAQGLQNKHATNAGFHISLSYLPEIEANPEHRTRVNSFLKKHFGIENGLEDIEHSCRCFERLPYGRGQQKWYIYPEKEFRI